ncbi:MAG: cell division protein ZapA [Rhodobacteraceae bacterium]|nr:cell division protein ZapA [Paracoccaceae bacterium]
MVAEQQSVPVRILGQEYVIACEPEEREQLKAAALYANQTLMEMRDGNKVLGTERLMVLAVLNIANDLLKANATQKKYEQSLGRLAKMQQRLDVVLVGAEQVPQPG